MATQTTEALVARIRTKCEHDRWFGPHARSPETLIVKESDPLRIAFAYPPATTEQLIATEQALGFPLLPLLRTLYRVLANGGYGPGYGLRGAMGGYGTPAEPFNEYTSDDTIVGCYTRRKERASFINLAEYADQWRQHGKRLPFLRLSSRLWPAGMLRICDLGCLQEICMDRDGLLYLETPANHDKDGTRLEMEEESGIYHYQYFLERLDYSLEDWIEAWIRNDMHLYPGSR